MIVPLGNELRRAAHSSDHRSAELDRALAQRSSGSTRHQIAAELRRRQQDMYLYTDVVPTLVLAALWLLLPYEASAELRIGGCVLLVAGALSTRIVRTRSPLSWSNFAFVASRVVLALILAFLLPSMWYAAVICIAIMVVGFVPMESPRRIIALTVVATAATSAIAIFRSVPLWYLANAAQLVSVITATIWFHQWSEGQNEIDRLHNEVIDRARMFSWEVDVSTGEILSIAGNVEAVLGFTAGQLIGKHVRTIVFPDDRLSVLAEPSTDDSDLHAEVSVRHRDGHRVHLREVRHRSTTEGTIRGVSIDITELALAGEALRYQAEHDGLTGLANRTVIERSVSEASADPKTANVALVLADLDRFKEINDTLGHPTGDRVLCILANRFAEGLGAADVVARLGGDEFAVVARVDARAAIELADKLHGLATAPVAVDGLQLAVACSVGVAVAPDHGSGFPDLLKHADIATYQAKRAGGGVQLFESAPDELSITRLQLISEVPAALDRQQFKLYLQPQVDLTTGQVVGVEGLARWLHPELGLLTPDSFLNAIEVASDYHRFTREMLRQAVDLAASIATVSRPLPVAVNLSSMSFLDKSLPGYIATLLRNRSLPGSSLTLEVTESDLLDEHRADAPVFAALKAIGVSLSLDDFGTGYSTLTRLRELDVDEVKVDQAFVAGLDGHSEDTIIVQAIVQLGQLLGHHVVAEGVETIDQLAVLRTLGCTTGQGHLFAPAMPEADFLSLLEARMSYTHLTARQSPAESLHHNGRPGNAAARQARE